jgi:hypothetical protein
MEPPVQANQESRILLVEVDEIRRSLFFEHVSPLFETASASWLGKFFARKDERGISRFIADRHLVRKRIPPCHPPHIHAQLLVHPRTRHVGGLVT